PPEVLGREELWDGHSSDDGAEEAVGLFLVMPQGGEELLLLGRRRLERGKLAGQLVERHRGLVAPSLIVREGFLQRTTAREPLVTRLDQQLGSAEGVSDPLRGDWVLVIAGIAHQRPAGAIGPAEEVGQVGRAGEALLPLALAHPLRKRRRQLQRAEEV